MDSKEFEEFKHTLVQKLPVTFRVNPCLPHHQSLVAMFTDPQFVQKNAKASEQPSSETRAADFNQIKSTDMRTVNIPVDEIAIDCKPYYPNSLLFEINMQRQLFKKNQAVIRIKDIV